jgi:hypothetical protein
MTKLILNTFTNYFIWAFGFSFQVPKNLNKFVNMVNDIKPCGMMMGNPFDNIMGSIIELRCGGGFNA